MENSYKSFNELGLSSKLSSILNNLNYKTPFKIQEMCIPEILNNFDILGIANTGSGKTAAFVLPLLDKIKKNIKYSQILILEPTRELVIQLGNVISLFTKNINWINNITIYGGQKFLIQLKLLKLIQHIIICTPGRLIEHINKKTIDLSKISSLVIDEADEMFKMGFIDDVKKIISKIPKNRQTLLFSATMPKQLKNIAYGFMNNKFKEILINNNNDLMKLNIKQYYYVINNNYKKEDILIKFLSIISFESIIIFTNTKNKTLEISNFLRKFDYNSFYLNGDMKQSFREKTIKLFKLSKLSILVATDVASRGLDISKISWVINFDFPYNEDIYIHRIGRTGRAGNIGKSLSLLNYKELKILKNSNNKIININPIKLPDFDINNYKIINLIKNIEKLKINEIDLDKYKKYIDKLLKITDNNLDKLVKIILYVINNKYI